MSAAFLFLQYLLLLFIQYYLKLKEAIRLSTHLIGVMEIVPI